MTGECDHKFIDSNHCLKCGWRPPSVTDASVQELADARTLRNEIRCVYCNERLKGWAAMTLHELVCVDRAAAERQYQRARERFQRKRAGFA